MLTLPKTRRLDFEALPFEIVSFENGLLLRTKIAWSDQVARDELCIEVLMREVSEKLLRARLSPSVLLRHLLRQLPLLKLNM